MPELPEVENVGRAIAAALIGRAVTGVKAPFSGVLGQSLRATRKALVGKQLADVHRHGKYLILNFTGEGGGEAHLMIHLRMTGQIFVMDGYVPDKHVHVSFDFDGVPVHYRDIRKFGRLVLVEDGRRPAALDHVGPDMLTVRWSEWHARAAHRAAPIKAVLLDQGVAAGLGNIYVDESLFLARVHPEARPRDLDDATLREVLKRAKQVLRLAIKHGGTTFMNFADFHGRPGNFRRKLRVYGRGGEDCRDCGGTLEKTVVGGRGTVFCPRCQS
ncbi:MAG: bifunctional DNA-formamidopyrimidine glycosylase/DNA-(apurinic or apyrimidinic site) lyase [bacterium]|nr:bifunctional DNA-formamidopyrimidine glycosylase/DNA-(apurinic or apyrimidinic site) lyase [bacterium]